MCFKDDLFLLCHKFLSTFPLSPNLDTSQNFNFIDFPKQQKKQSASSVLVLHYLHKIFSRGITLPGRTCLFPLSGKCFELALWPLVSALIDLFLDGSYDWAVSWYGWKNPHWILIREVPALCFKGMLWEESFIFQLWRGVHSPVVIVITWIFFFEFWKYVYYQWSSTLTSRSSVIGDYFWISFELQQCWSKSSNLSFRINSVT